MTRIGKRLAAVFLAVAMVITFMPVLGTQTAYAASGDPAMNLGTEVLNKNVNTANPESVWYADTTWRVIGYDGTGAATVSGAATLLAANELDRTKFDTSSPYSNVYAGSALEEKVNGILNRFTPEERAAINARTLVHGSYNTESPWDTDCIAGDTDLENVFLWPLSAKEGTALNYNLRENSGDFWLRSPGKADNRAFYIQDTGTGSTSTVDWNFAVRPAFHLNIGSVLLTSAAEGGKSSGACGADALKEISDNTTNEWKLTLKDASRSGFNAVAANGATLEMEEGYSGWSAPVVYSGAQTGENEFVSVILCDSEGTAKYYGNIAQNSAASSDAGQTVNIPEGLAAGSYTMYVFNEQINGDKLTDYASEFSAIELTVKPLSAETFTVTFKAAGGIWTDGTTADKQVTVDKGQAATAPDVPTRDGFTFDGWDPEDFSNITSNLTVTAQWKENSEPRPQPATQTITASNVTKTYGNAAFNLNAKTNGDGTLTYKSSNTKVVTVSSAGKVTIKGAGTAKITISASATANYKAASKTITVTVNKAANPLTIKAKTAPVKYSKLKKKTQTLAVTKVIKFTKDAKDKKTYTLSSAKKGSKSFKKYFKINKTTGKVTIKKNSKMKKGTYKVKVKVKAAGNANYNASAVKTVTFKVKVK